MNLVRTLKEDILAPISLKEKIGYGLGDMGFNFFVLISRHFYLCSTPMYLVFLRRRPGL